MEEIKLFTTPEEAEKAFYTAFQQQDVELMMSVWSDGEDITCIHPGGPRLGGQTDIRESWEQIFSHENGIKFEINQKRVQMENDIAIHHVIESIYMDGELQSEIIATNVYRKSRDSWYMVLHHASPELRPAVSQIESEEELLEEETKTFH
ncbi:MAG: nuclear transport factor 2 family protein [Gammaproteobacteria bacterium]